MTSTACATPADLPLSSASSCRAAEPVLRKVAGVKADHFGPAMVMHCAQEMNHLALILPSLHEAFYDEP